MTMRPAGKKWNPSATVFDPAWKFKGSAGPFRVYHAARNVYFVVGLNDEVMHEFEQFGLAWSCAMRHEERLAQMDELNAD